MGERMKEDDIYVPSFLEYLNLRFAPRQGNEPEWFGGVDEVAALQREFAVFQKGRSFQKSAALLGLGGHLNSRARNRWFTVLTNLANYSSNKPGQNGDECIVNAIIENLAASSPLPVFFKAHDLRAEGRARVIVGEEPRPVFYLEQDYLTVSLPMRPAPKT
jgi:hypothetical protein